MNLMKRLGILILVSLLASCGGGGGSAGSAANTTATTATTTATTSTTAETTTSVTGDTSTTAAGAISLQVLGGSGADTSSISTLEIAQAKVTITDAKGAPASGVIVSFSETGAGLLSISPSSRTALTDLLGQASVEIKGISSSSTGATQVTASATISGASVSAQKAITLSSAPSSGPVVAPQDLANAINFLSVDPADQSIVLAGSGGSGRSESATLKFRVVDKNNTPVKGVAVTFAAIPSTAVTLNIPTASSDSDGVVTTTVSSKSVAAALVVKATVDTKTITTQSDTLLVTTGVATAAGFDLSASKYNLNSGISGDSSTVTVRVVDSNGNPVADGVPIVFTSTHGAVGSSARGGCTTVGGACTVNYLVQDPRPADGVLARVTASTQVGSGTVISNGLNFVFSQPSLLNLFSAQAGGAALASLDWTAGSCKFTVSAFVGTPAGFGAPANTTVGVTSLTSDFTASIKSGGTILDQARLRTSTTFEFDASNALLVPKCVSTGPSRASAFVEVTFTAGTIVKTIVLPVTYPIP